MKITGDVMFKLFGSPTQFVHIITAPVMGGAVEPLPTTAAEFEALDNRLSKDEKVQLVTATIAVNKAKYTTADNQRFNKALNSGNQDQLQLLFEFFFHPDSEFYDAGDNTEKFARDLDAIVTNEAANPVSNELTTTHELASQSTLIPVDRKTTQSALYKEALNKENELSANLQAIRLAADLDGPEHDETWSNILRLDPFLGLNDDTDPPRTAFADIIKDIVGEDYVNSDQQRFDQLVDHLRGQTRKARELQSNIISLLNSIDYTMHQDQQRTLILENFTKQTGLKLKTSEADSQPYTEFYFTDTDGEKKLVKIKPIWVNEYDPSYKAGVAQDLNILPDQLVFEVRIQGSNGEEVRNMSATQLKEFNNSSEHLSNLVEAIPNWRAFIDAVGLTKYGQDLNVGCKIDYLQDSGSTSNSSVVEILALDENAKEVQLSADIILPNGITTNIVSFNELAKWWRMQGAEPVMSTEHQAQLLHDLAASIDPSARQTLESNGEKIVAIRLEAGQRLKDRFGKNLGITAYNEQLRQVTLTTGETLSDAQFIRMVKEEGLIGLFTEVPELEDEEETQDRSGMESKADERERLRFESEEKAAALEAKKNRAMQIALKAKNKERGAWQFLQDNIEWASLGEMIEVFKLVGGQFKEILDNRKKMRAGALGQRLLPDQFGGSQAEQEKVSAMQAVVKRHMDRLENQSNSNKIWAEMTKSNDLFVVYACIKVLAAGGKLRFDDPRLWKALNNCIGPSGNRTLLIPINAFLNDPNAAQQSVFNVLNNLIGAGKGEEIFGTNSGNFDQEANKYLEEAKKVAGDGNLAGEMKDMLEQWKDSNTTDAYSVPHRYLKFLMYAIDEDEISPQEIMFLVKAAFTQKNDHGVAMLPSRLISSLGPFAKKYFPMKHFNGEVTNPASVLESIEMIQSALTKDGKKIDESVVLARMAFVDLWKEKTWAHARKGKQGVTKDSVHLAITVFSPEDIKDMMGIGVSGYGMSTMSLNADEMQQSVGGFSLMMTSLAMLPSDPKKRKKYDEIRSKSKVVSSDDMIERLVKNFVLFKAGTLGQAGNQKRDASFLRQNSHGLKIGDQYKEMGQAIAHALIAAGETDPALIKVVKHHDIVEEREMQEEHARLIERFPSILDKMTQNKAKWDAFSTALINEMKKGTVTGMEVSQGYGKINTGELFRTGVAGVEGWDPGYKELGKSSA